MMVQLSEDIKEVVRLALKSHDKCLHDANLCFLLIGTEVELRRGVLLDEEEFQAVGVYVADCILESLILKGMVEATAVDENGELLFGVTDAGKEAHSRFKDEEDR